MVPGYPGHAGAVPAAGAGLHHPGPIPAVHHPGRDTDDRAGSTAANPGGKARGAAPAGAGPCVFVYRAGVVCFKAHRAAFVLFMEQL